MRKIIVITFFAFVLFTASYSVMAQQTTPDQLSLTQAEASHFASLAMKCIQKEYPNKLDHVNNDAADVRSPRAMHGTFYGCFDWHSSVHGHWMLVHLLRLFPAMPDAGKIRAALNANLEAKNISGEVAYLGQANRASFERTYGWAWLLKLAEELRGWNDEDGQRWSHNLQPLADALAEKYLSFMPKQTYPIRTGVHPNTAFGLAFALDYARAVGNQKLEALIVERSRFYYGHDVNYPAAWEPGGEDFFSPAIVTDRTDPKLVHLDGLNLSRAWCMRSIAAALPRNDPARGVLTRSALAHAKVTLPHVASGSYEGEHWLASFAVYLLTTSAP